MYNCIYDDKTVISSETDSCLETLPSGATLVDTVSESTEVTVTTDPPASGITYLLGFAVLLWFGGLFVRH